VEAGGLFVKASMLYGGGEGEWEKKRCSRKTRKKKERKGEFGGVNGECFRVKLDGGNR